MEVYKEPTYYHRKQYGRSVRWDSMTTNWRKIDNSLSGYRGNNLKQNDNFSTTTTTTTTTTT